MKKCLLALVCILWVALSFGQRTTGDVDKDRQI
jgi:hypothetical protein